MLLASFVATAVWSATAQSPIKVQPFPLKDVQLLAGPFQDAHKVGVEYLKMLEPDRLVAGFRTCSGLQPKAMQYLGYESQGYAGHTVGHYLTACSQEVAATGDPTLKSRVDYVIDELTECMKNRPDGYLSAILDSEKAWTEARSGQIQTNQLLMNGLWSPWKIQSCVLSGLLNGYRYAKSQKALLLATKIGDWAIELTRRFDDSMWQTMLVSSYGCIARDLADLSVYTKNGKYLELAKKFYDVKTLDPLRQGVDNLESLSPSIQSPKITSLARIFELNSEASLARAAKFFWYTVTKHHTYVLGGMGHEDAFGKPDSLSRRLGRVTNGVTCTSDFLDLTRHLFQWDPRPEFADYYERALINTVLPCQDSKPGFYAPIIPLYAGASLFFSFPFEPLSEESGVGMESQTRLQDSIYYHASTQRLYVNLYVASELNWLGQRIRQESSLPESDKVTFTILTGSKQAYEMAFRHPGWEKSDLQVKVNGVVVATSSKPSSYIIVKRVWRPGDKVELTLPLSLQTAPMVDNPRIVALTFGPVVLAADIARKIGLKPEPILFAKSQVDSLSRVPGTLDFTSKDGSLTFRPLAKLYERKYAVYVEPLSDSELIDARRRFDVEAARKAEIESRTIDIVRFLDHISEVDHKYQGQHVEEGSFGGRGYRTVLTEGVMDLDFKSDPSLPVQLIVTYFGNERLRPDFSILANGQQLAIERLNGRPTNEFFEVIYKIPEEATQGNKMLKVEFLATPNKTGPSVSEICVVRAKG